MHVALTIVLAWAALFLTFTAVWWVQLRTLNAGMVDPVWAASLGGVALLVAACGTGAPINRLCVAAGGAIWGARLALHLWRRNHAKPEDPRYRALREQWGTAAARNMFGFFQLQAVISLALSVAFFVPAYRPDPPSTAALSAGICIWLAAVAGEALADRQLRRFVADPDQQGKVCRVGLWRYSRHPNYFFECTHWLAYSAISLGTPWLWLTLLAPVLMAWLLLKVSGIPILEARLMQTRAGYREYVQTTSALVPWPPRTNTRETST